MKRKFLLTSLLFSMLFLMLGNSASAARVGGHWSGIIYHHNISTGVTNTEYSYSIDVDKVYTYRTEISYSGYTASYYTARFMDPNISYKFGSSFLYKAGSSSGSTFGSISIYSWSGPNKYAYITPGSPNRTAAQGLTKFFATPAGQSANLTASIFILCSKDTGYLTCGDKTFTKGL